MFTARGVSATPGVFTAPHSSILNKCQPSAALYVSAQPAGSPENASKHAQPRLHVDGEERPELHAHVAADAALPAEGVQNSDATVKQIARARNYSVAVRDTVVRLRLWWRIVP